MGFTFCSSPETSCDPSTSRARSRNERSPRSGSGENVFVDAAGLSGKSGARIFRNPRIEKSTDDFPRIFYDPTPANNFDDRPPQNSAQRYSGHLGR